MTTVVPVTDGEVVSRLLRSYSRQGELYRALSIVNQKILGKLAVARGDVSITLDLFDEKKEILATIEAERNRIVEEVTVWQDRKNLIRKKVDTRQLDAALDTMQQIIGSVIDAEEKLSLYISDVQVAEKGS